MIPRLLEPEVMDSPHEAAQYDAMDHSQVNRLFVDDFLNLLAQSESLQPADCSSSSQKILDVGTGTAQIPIELCKRKADCQVVAIDLAACMLQLANENIEKSGMAATIQTQLVDSKKLSFKDHSYDAVISNSIVHHIPQPILSLAEMMRVLKPGGAIFIRDLHRPDSLEELEDLVHKYAGDENDYQQKMFRESLHAALTLSELHEILGRLGLPAEWAKLSSDRHWTISGVMK